MSDEALVARAGGDGDIRAAETIAKWMDDRFLDPILGFALPGVGDVIGSVLGLYVVGVALRRRLPLVTVARMLVNLGVDGIVGAVPVAGDLFDVAWKANRKNVRLLRQRHEARQDTVGDWLRVVGAFALLVAGVVIPVAAAWWMVHAIVALFH
ncbi:MAG TPA: DUF4112 domain-containing protein [Polyangia bacterium]|nr:DUF4112 domain-containing protein [Polyangia bacterium]